MNLKKGRKNRKKINYQLQIFVIALLTMITTLILINTVLNTVESKKQNKKFNLEIIQIKSKLNLNDDDANSNKNNKKNATSNTKLKLDIEKLTLNMKKLNFSIQSNKKINKENKLIINQLKLKIKEISKNLEILSNKTKNNLETDINLQKKNLNELKENLKENITTIANIVLKNSTLQVKFNELNKTVQKNSPSNPKLSKMFDSTKSIIYQNIFSAFEKKIFIKYKNPKDWDETKYKLNKLFNRNVITIGSKFSIDSGIKVNFPKEGDNDLLWLRTFSELNHECIDVSYENDEKIGSFCLGFSSFKFGPFSDKVDSLYPKHCWYSIPVYLKKNVIIKINKFSTNKIMLSGIAFSKNTNNYVAIDSYTIQTKLNGGNYKMNVYANGYTMIAYEKNEIIVLKIPVIPNGKDKLFFLCSIFNNFFAIKILINGNEIESFFVTYDNPFSRYFNHVISTKYYAARIPAKFINANEYFISATLHKINIDSYIRIAGTHDYN